MEKLNRIKEYLGAVKAYSIGTREDLKKVKESHRDTLFTFQYFSSMYALVAPIMAAQLHAPEVCLIGCLYAADMIQRVWAGPYMMDDTTPGIIGTLRDPKNWNVESKLENLVTT